MKHMKKTDPQPIKAWVQVKVLGRKNAAALVEYVDDSGRLNRVSVPFAAVVNDQVVKDELAYGIPYGVPWAEIITLSATPQAIEEELHRRGIWTAHDANTQTEQVVAAVNAAYGLDASAIIRAANALSRGEK